MWRAMPHQPLTISRRPDAVVIVFNRRTDGASGFCTKNTFAAFQEQYIAAKPDISWKQHPT